MDAFSKTWRRILNLVGRGRVTLTDDSGVVQVAQVTLGEDERRDDVPRLAEYGFTSVPPVGSDAVMVFIAGERSNGVVIATGNQTYRLRGLASGDVALYDNRGQTVTLTADGIKVTAPAVVIEAEAIQLTGSTNFTGPVTANGHRIDETHKHTGVSSGASVSGPVL